MKRFFEGLTFKIGIAVILIQIAALTTMGFYYINRFSGEIDRSMQTRIETPGMLMTQGMLTYEAVSDRTIMEELIGETLIDSLVIGLNQQIFYALNPNDVGRDVNSILDPQFVAQLEEITIQSKSTQMTDGLVNITPLSLRDGKLVGFLYLKIGTEQLARQKRLVALVFILGSIFCIFSTSIGIILLFRSIILTRIGKLLAVSQQVASGSLTARINGPISQDEIGILQHSINLMAAELEKTIGNLHAEIAERIKAGAALRASESWFRTIYDGVNDAIFIHDANTGAILDVNRKACEMYGYSQAEMLQLRIADVSQGYPPFGQQEATALVQKTQTQGPQLFEWRAKDRNGHLFWVEVNLRQARIYGQDRVLAAVRDITERKQAEELREALIEELEAKNTELERFTYTVSHDLKSPLITIGGFVGFLAKDALAGNVERVKTDIARINDATAKMQQLLNELLELSRIGRLMNPPEEVSFAEIAREAVELVRGRIEMRGVEVEIAPDLPTVYGDRVRLVEVVQNLVDNACKFMGDQPQPRVEIGMRGADTGGKPILFVRDNGIGIEPQYHDRIFGLFDKLDPQSEGTGVGLALVKRIVETHNGKVWVESEGAGHSSTFCLTLPAAS